MSMLVSKDGRTSKRLCRRPASALAHGPTPAARQAPTRIASSDTARPRAAWRRSPPPLRCLATQSATSTLVPAVGAARLRSVSPVPHPPRCAPVSHRQQRPRPCPPTALDGAGGARRRGGNDTHGRYQYPGVRKHRENSRATRTNTGQNATSDVQYARPRHTHTTTSHKPH